MTGGSRQIEPVHKVELFDSLHRFGAEWSFALKGMQDDAFQQVAQAAILIFRQRLQNFEDPLLHAHTGLNALDLQSRLRFRPSLRCDQG